MEEFKYLIPEDSNDAIITNVSLLRKIESDLRNIFSNYYYTEVLMPSFEYVDLYTKLDCGIEQERMIQYINHEGKSVALRLDFTIPLARLYANGNYETERRYCYFGKVYRKESMHKGRSSESYQGGVELMGKEGIEGDKECLSIIQESLPKLQLDRVIIELSSAKFYNRLLTLVGSRSKELVKILKMRNISAMKEFVGEEYNQKLTSLLLELPTLVGDINMLNKVIDSLEDTILLEALNELKETYYSLDKKENIIFDLCMVPAMKYYTGLMFKGYNDKSASPIISGGRYDDLLPRFDCNKGAIGFSYNLNQILDALGEKVITND